MDVLCAQNVAVSYQLPNRRYTSLKEYVVARLKRERNEVTKFEALKGVSLNLRASECVGLIGHNGCGKSTLLKVLSGILTPTRGGVRYQGRMTSLIELGAGFDAELDVIDNIFLACSLMGFSKQEIKNCLPEIIEFSELENFKDFPIKNFSSGMAARLGFACATMVVPDILLVDEVLAVGDESFQQKCFKKIRSLKEKNKSIVLVTHDMEAVRKFCDRVYVLDHGSLVFEGSVEDGIRKYRELLSVPNH